MNNSATVKAAARSGSLSNEAVAEISAAISAITTFCLMSKRIKYLR